MATLPLLVNELLEFLKKEPGLIIFALVVVIGIIQAIARGVKKVLETTGLGGPATDARGELAADGRRPATARRDPVLDADPESLLPSVLRRGSEKPAPEPPPVRFEPEPPPIAKRRTRRRERPAEPLRVQAAREEAERDDDHQTLVKGPLVTGHATATHTTHDADVRTARKLLGRGRPTRDQVRTAVLWGEILGPPRALNPYRAPSRRRGGGGGPSSIAIVPLRDRRGR